jgi:hypothetical protein
MKRVVLVLHMLGLAMMFALGAFLFHYSATVYVKTLFFDESSVLAFSSAIMMMVYPIYSVVFIRKKDIKFDVIRLVLLAVTVLLYCVIVHSTRTFVLDLGYVYNVLVQPTLGLAVFYMRSEILLISVILIVLPAVCHYFSKKGKSEAGFSPKKSFVVLRICGLVMLLASEVFLLFACVKIYFEWGFENEADFAFILATAISILVFCVYSLVFGRKIGTKFELAGFVLLVVMTFLYCITTDDMLFYSATNSLSSLISEVITGDMKSAYPISTMVVRLRDFIYIASVVLVLLPSTHRLFQKKAEIQ